MPKHTNLRIRNLESCRFLLCVNVETAALASNSVSSRARAGNMNVMQRFCSPIQRITRGNFEVAHAALVHGIPVVEAGC